MQLQVFGKVCDHFSTDELNRSQNYVYGGIYCVTKVTKQHHRQVNNVKWSQFGEVYAPKLLG